MFLLDFFRNLFGINKSGDTKDNSSQSSMSNNNTNASSNLPLDSNSNPVISAIQKKNMILTIMNVAETGTLSTDYCSVYIYADGKNNRKQITLSRGFTEDGGNLKEVIKQYIYNGGKKSAEFTPHIAKMGAAYPSLSGNSAFINLLKSVCQESAMIRAQDEVFDNQYWIPAYRWFTSNGFTLPLSMLVIMDSYLHSGSILSFLREKFKESPPIKGGKEKEWIAQYVNVRHDWLKNHSNKILNNTIYRTNCFKLQIASNNWELRQDVVMNGTRIKAS